MWFLSDLSLSGSDNTDKQLSTNSEAQPCLNALLHATVWRYFSRTGLNYAKQTKGCRYKNRAAYLKLAVFLQTLCGFTVHRQQQASCQRRSRSVLLLTACYCALHPSLSRRDRKNYLQVPYFLTLSSPTALQFFLSISSVSVSPSLSFDCPLISQPVSSTLSFSGSVSIFIYPSPSIHLHPSLHHVLSAPCCCFIHLPLSFLSLLSLSVTFYIPLNLSYLLVFCLSVGLFYISFRPFVG